MGYYRNRRNGISRLCEHILKYKKIDEVKKKKMIKNKTELQSKIFKAIRGEKISEVIHAFEIIKIDLFLDKDLTFLDKDFRKE